MGENFVERLVRQADKQTGFPRKGIGLVRERQSHFLPLFVDNI